MLGLFKDILFPPRCAGCMRYVAHGAICDQCREKIDINSTFMCGLCGARLPDGKKICHQAFPYILGGASSYDCPVVSSLIRALKFDLVRDCARPLAEIIIEYVRKAGFDAKDATIIPVPLGPKRMRKRGFNQAELIAKIVSEELGIPMSLALARNRETAKQSDLNDKGKRMANVRSCFSLTPEVEAPKHAVLIDDVSTTGATLFSAACALKTAGTRRIHALVSAKA